jgi:hypothetical protein
MKLSEMRELLVRRDIQLTKSLGQNFLHDAHQLERIIAAADLTPADKAHEIGPGLGPLTALLLEKAGKVLAIEKDGRLVEVLRERFAAYLTPVASSEGQGSQPSPTTRFELLHEDALEFLKREPRDWSEWKLVANLPYSVASPILVELAAGAWAPKMIVATLQRCPYPPRPTGFPTPQFLQDTAWLLFPFPGRGLRLRHPRSSSPAAPGRKSPRPLLSNRQTCLLPAAQNDAETSEAGMAQGKA